MNPKYDWDEGSARMEDLDSEDLEIEELLDIEDKIEEKIENLEARAAEISGDLLGKTLGFGKKKVLAEEKEALEEALESLMAQRANVRLQLQGRGYDGGGEKNG